MADFFEFTLRPQVMYKSGLVDDLALEAARLGGTRVLLVADRGVIDAGLLERVQVGLGGSIEIAGVFGDVPANSSVAAVQAGAAIGREGGADLVIAVGGGSPIDTAKAIRILLGLGGSLHDYQGYNLIDAPLVPMIAVPTTAGTGSEVTPFAVIRDDEQQIKMTFASPFLAPDLAVLDPEMTRGLPPGLTAATGMDALTHAIEAFVSTQANLISDSLALQAIDTISNSLREATHSGDNMDARGRMLVASCMAGMAFSSALVGLVHAIAHAIGGKFPVHHGAANSILLPHGMRFNSTVAPNRYARIARALGVNAGGRAEEDVIEDGIAAAAALAANCGLPNCLRDVGVPHEALAALAEVAATDAAIFSNPRPATPDEIAAVLDAAW